MPDWLAVMLANFRALFDTRTELALAAFAFGLAVAYASRRRRVYFVRHGQTKANAEHVRQDDKGPLSELGRAQAVATAECLAAFPIKEIVSSPYERAAETAAIIAERLKLPVTYSVLLVERRNPSAIVGKRDEDPEVIRIVDQIDRAYHEDDYRYSDEENFADMKARARKLLDLFAHQGARHTVAVTHGIYLKMVIAYLLTREALHAGDYAKLSFFNASDNAGITICEYNPWKMFGATRGWRVIDYNFTAYQTTGVRAQELPRPPIPGT